MREDRGIIVGFLTAQTLPEVETILGSDFTAPFVFLGIFVAIIGFVVATLFANLALKKKKDKERAIPIRVLGSRGVAIPVLDSAPEST